MNIAAGVLVALSALSAVGCDRAAQAGSPRGSDSARSVTQLKVDSILPSGEALRRFQAELSPVTVMSSPARSRDQLVARFIDALETVDTATLNDLHVSKAEYAFLYFPSSVYSRKPYELPPDIAWLLSEQGSQKGRTRITRRLAGKTLDFHGYECDQAATEGDNRFWRSCRLRYIDPATKSPVTRQLFGAIIERNGRYKFLSYANDF